MAETQAAGAPLLPRRDGPTRPPAAMAPPASEGQPIAEVPPLVEFADEPAAAPSARRPRPASGQRPERRRFLAPIPAAAWRTRDELPTRRAEDLGAPGHRLRAAVRAMEPEEAASGRRRRWPLLLALGVGLAAALAVAVTAEIGAGRDWIGRLRAVVAQHLAPPPAAPRTAVLAADSGRHLADVAARAAAGDADAQLALAIRYAKGDGVPQDYAAAAKWFRAAAEHGVMRAQYDLGVLYERGRGVPIDYAEAASWYRKAAEQNDPLAQYNLAVAYTKGRGVGRDLFAAAVWYHRAALHGVVAAMVNLAILYERGDGLDSSAADAYAWYRAAARRGSQPAAERADALLQSFAPIEQTRAEERTTAVAAAIRDPIGERARLAAGDAAARPAPVLKSGIETEPTAAPGRPGAENP